MNNTTPEIMRFSHRPLSRLFIEAPRMPAPASLQALKIERAKELLKISNSDFETITERVGYGDTSLFRRQFKRVLSPARYPRRGRKNFYVNGH